MIKKLNKIYKNSRKISIDENSKFVVISDCHRGAGDNFDNFLKNKNIFDVALEYYYNNGYTYIELGDGDDMWEVKNYKDIIEAHIDSFKKIKKFHNNNRLFMIYGNHDIVKKSNKILKEYFYEYYNNITKCNELLLDELVVSESLILTYNNYDIFLIHGHQVDFLNSTIWRFSRFLVRNVWRVLERLGIKDFTGGARRYSVSKRIEKKLERWSKINDKIIIAGHTHRAIFPKVGESLYFNDGSCIHQNGITCLEIENGNISLVKWEYTVNEDNLIMVDRKVLEGNESIVNFYKLKS